MLGCAGSRVEVQEGGFVQGSVFEHHVLTWFEDELRRHVRAVLDRVVVGFAYGADVFDVGAFSTVTAQATYVAQGVARFVVWVVAFSTLIAGVIVRDVDTQGHATVDARVCSECEEFGSRNLLWEGVKAHRDGMTAPCPSDGVSLPGNVKLGEQTHDVFRACAFRDIHDVETEGPRFVDESELASAAETAQTDPLPVRC